MITSSAISASCAPRVGLGDDEVDARFDRPADLLLEHRAHRRASEAASPSTKTFVFEMSPAQSVSVSSATSLAISERLPVERLELVLPADDAKLLAVRVVRERLDDVGAGVDEVAVKLVDDLGVVEHDLGNERARLQVARAARARRRSPPRR